MAPSKVHTEEGQSQWVWPAAIKINVHVYTNHSLNTWFLIIGNCRGNSNDCRASVWDLLSKGDEGQATLPGEENEWELPHCITSALITGDFPIPLHSLNIKLLIHTQHLIITCLMSVCRVGRSLIMLFLLQSTHSSISLSLLSSCKSEFLLMIKRLHNFIRTRFYSFRGIDGWLV